MGEKEARQYLRRKKRNRFGMLTKITEQRNKRYNPENGDEIDNNIVITTTSSNFPKWITIWALIIGLCVATNLIDIKVKVEMKLSPPKIMEIFKSD